MEINHEKLKYISGPVSVAKLKGKINGIDKDILLFGDVHKIPNAQTECKDPNSVTIKQYLNDIFSKSKTKIDFFLEIGKSPEDSKMVEPYTKNYIQQLGIFFKNNKDKYKNARFHFSDIRNDFDLFDFVYGISKQINNFLANTFFFIDEINYILDYLDEVIKYINIVTSGLKNNKFNFERNMNNEYTNSDIYNFYKDVNKILFKIKNKKIEANNRSILKILLKNLITDINNFKKECSLIKNNLESSLFYSVKEEIELSSKIKLKFNEISTKLSVFFTTINDLYILRRFLDKDYITNAIVYTGNNHTANLMNILVNYFDFRITNIFSTDSYKLNVDKNYIKNIYKNIFDFNLNTKHEKNLVIQQCVDISKFKKPLIDF
tara:strand:- start:150 stop:1280 length:1131 start_codon:yes stop_codon:yes gene_type:complete